MRHKVTFHPQAWLNDNAIDVDPQGDTVFYVTQAHLEQFTPDQLKYEVEPYEKLPQLPEWIREWQGTFYFEVGEPSLIILQREGDGAYRYEDWSIQCPHLMYGADPDTNWYATNSEGEALGPFDDLDQVREYLTRYTTIDDWRGEVAMHIRELGRGDIADEFGGISDQEAMVYRDSEENPSKMAQRIINSAPPQPKRQYAVTIADTYTHLQVIEVEATTEAEARAKAERQYEETYDAAHVFEAFAMNGTEGEHSAVEVNELEPA